MLLRLFKGNNPGSIVLITVIAISVWIGAFLHPSANIAARFDPVPMPLYGLFVKIIGLNVLARAITAFVICAGLIFLVMHFNTTNFFINERTYLPVLIYSLAIGFIPEYQTLNPALPAAVFLMLAIMRIIDSYRKPGLANNFFDAAILISIGSLFYANLIWFGLLIIIGILLIRTVNISEIAIALIGFTTPYFILFGVYYVLGMDLKGLTTLISENLFNRMEGYHFTRLTIAAGIICGIEILISLGYLLSRLSNKKVKSRQIFSMLIWTFLVTIAVIFVLPTASVEITCIAAIPVSYFMTHYFVFVKKKILPDILLVVLLLSVFMVQFFYYR
jgi:hypothetical protein